MLYSHGQTGDGTSHTAVHSQCALTDSSQGDNVFLLLWQPGKAHRGFESWNVAVLSSQG